MPEKVFSEARLRVYRALEAEGLGAAHELLITTTLIGARLWLPLSLIEIAFRNAVDEALKESHARGADWLFEAGSVSGPVFSAKSVRGSRSLCLLDENGVLVDDPVAGAAQVAARGNANAGDDTVTRDDVIAHLMLGFWVVRVPEGLADSDPVYDVFDLVSRRLNSQLGDGLAVRKLMARQILEVRNRVAHHESVVIRAKHVYDKQKALKTDLELATSLESALGRFDRDSELIISTARHMAPMASSALAQVTAQIQGDLQPFRATLLARVEELRRVAVERRAARRAAVERGEI
jgi:hypothetical protein